MRLPAFAVAATLATITLATSLSGQSAAEPVNARSAALVAQARAARATGDLGTATDLLETAAAVDPRNREAFVALAQVAELRGLPGKAIRFYREALALDANDTAALRGQGEALVAKGALVRARENLAKIRTLCKAGCTDATALAATIAKGPPVTTAQAVSPAKATTASN